MYRFYVFFRNHALLFPKEMLPIKKILLSQALLSVFVWIGKA